MCVSFIEQVETRLKTAVVAQFAYKPETSIPDAQRCFRPSPRILPNFPPARRQGAENLGRGGWSTRLATASIKQVRSTIARIVHGGEWIQEINTLSSAIGSYMSAHFAAQDRQRKLAKKAGSPIGWAVLDSGKRQKLRHDGPIRRLIYSPSIAVFVCSHLQTDPAVLAVGAPRSSIFKAAHGASGFCTSDLSESYCPRPARNGMRGLHLVEHALTYIAASWEKRTPLFDAGKAVPRRSSPATMR